MTTLEIVRGGLGALENALIDEVRLRQQGDPLRPVTIVVGQPLLIPYLRRRLTGALGGLANLRLTRLDQLAQELGEVSLIAQGRRPLPALGQRFVLEGIAASAGAYFEPVAGTPGLAQALRRLFDDLDDESLDPDQFGGATAQIEPAAVNRAKLETLATLYARYQRRLRRFYRPGDAFDLAMPERLDATCLLLYGVWRLSRRERGLLSRLGRRRPVVAFLPSANPDADRAHRALRDWLIEQGASERLVLPMPSQRSALGAVQRPATEPLPESCLDGSVRLLSAPDPVREVREAARACLDWARQGLAFYEMAVVYRQSEPYLELIDELFQDAGIPIYHHQPRPIARQASGRGALLLLQLIGSRLRRADVMEFLTEARLSTRLDDRFGPVEPAAWDALSREAGIVEGREQWQERLRLLVDLKRRTALGDEDERDERLQRQLVEIERLAAFMSAFAERLDGFAATASWRVHLDSLSELLRDYLEGPESLIAGLEPLAGLAELREPVPFERFRRVARQALQQLEQPTTGDRDLGRDGVAVLDLESLCHLRFRATAVLGLVERAFPPPRRQDPLLLDDERRALNARFGWILPLRAEEPDIELLQFELALQSATERLLLSYARGDSGSSRPGLPSPFFRLAAERLTGRRVPAASIDALPAALLARIPSGRFATTDPAEAVDPVEYDRSLQARSPALGFACLVRRQPWLAQARSAWAARHESVAFGEWDGLIGAGEDQEYGWSAGLTGPISPSRLETYAACPYRYFLRYVLRLRPVEEPDLLERIESLERGTLVHEILHHFLALYGPDDAPSPRRRADHLTVLEEIAEEAFVDRERRGLVGYPLLWRRDRAAILEDLQSWYDLEAEQNQRQGLRPGAFEVRFGPRWTEETSDALSSDRPFELLVDWQRLLFQGRIDRIDWQPGSGGYRVIDYKTGSSVGYRDQSLRGGRQLQLPIYLLAAARLLGEGLDREIDWSEGEADYLFVSRRGGFSRVGLSGETLSGRWEAFSGLLRDLSSCIAAGDFHPEPSGGGQDNCRFCDYRDVCDSQIARLVARKAGSRSARFLRLTEVD